MLSKINGLALAIADVAQSPKFICTALDHNAPDLSLLAAAEIVVADPSLIENHLSSLKSCKWLASTWAGVEKLVEICSSTGDVPSWTLCIPPACGLVCWTPYLSCSGPLTIARMPSHLELASLDTSVLQ